MRMMLFADYLFFNFISLYLFALLNTLLKYSSIAVCSDFKLIDKCHSLPVKNPAFGLLVFFSQTMLVIIGKLF